MKTCTNLFKAWLEIVVIMLFAMLLFALTISESLGQQHHLYYKLVKNGDTVGDMTVTDTRSFTERHITSLLNADVPALFFNIGLADKKAVSYRDNILQSAVVSRSVYSGALRNKVTILRNNKYTDGNKMLPGLSSYSRIEFSMTMLYTTEPVGRREIYSEFHQQILPVTKVADHHYRIDLPDGQQGNYYYENGFCVLVETTTTWAKVKTILVKNYIASK